MRQSDENRRHSSDPWAPPGRTWSGAMLASLHPHSLGELYRFGALVIVVLTSGEIIVRVIDATTLNGLDRKRKRHCHWQAT